MSVERPAVRKKRREGGKEGRKEVHVAVRV
jgi:hypothetical protein